MIFVLALLGLLGFSLLNGGGSGDAKVPFNTPPPFSLKLYDGYLWEGKTGISPSAVKGRPLVINFWASWCVPCREEAPLLRKYAQEYGAKGVVFLGIVFQDREEDARSFLKQYGLTYPNGADTTGEISIEYGVTGIPETFFITADGRVIRKYIRPLTEEILKKSLDEITKPS